MTEVIMSPTGKKKRKVSLNAKLLPWIIAMTFLIAGLAGTLYFKNQADEVTANPSSAQQEKNQAETDRVLTSLKKIFFIDETEAPTVARVEDPEKLKSSNPTFYKNIQKGDYLVIYPKRAIIYREVINQVINTAPIINAADLKSDEGTTPAATETQPASKPTGSTTKKTN